MYYRRWMKDVVLPQHLTMTAINELIANDRRDSGHWKLPQLMRSFHLLHSQPDYLLIILCFFLFFSI